MTTEQNNSGTKKKEDDFIEPLCEAVESAHNKSAADDRLPHPPPTESSFLREEGHSYKGAVGGKGHGIGYAPLATSDAYRKYRREKTSKPCRSYKIVDGKVELSFATMFPDVLSTKNVAFHICNNEVSYVSPQLTQEDQFVVKEFISKDFPSIKQPVFEKSGGFNK